MSTLSSNSRGILLMVLSMLAFASEDLIIKHISTSLPVGQILMLIAAMSGTGFALYCLWKGHALFARRYWSKKIVLRAALEGVTGICMATAISLVDLTVVTAVFQTAPLVTTALAVLFLKEKASLHAWLAIIIGFLGVLLVVQPGLDAFEPAALLALIAVLSVSVHDLITRTLPDDIPTPIICMQSMVMFLPAGLFLLAITGQAIQPIETPIISYLLGLGIFAPLAYVLVIMALRVAKDTSAIMPFRFSRLIFAAVGAWLFFGEFPNALALFGACVIACAGLYMIWQDRREAAQ